MTKIEAIIRREKLEVVKSELDDLGVQGITVLEVQGAVAALEAVVTGHAADAGAVVVRGVAERARRQQRRAEERINLLPKLMIITVVPDEQVDDVVGAIIAAARTGEIGDGKIFLTQIADAIRIRTSDRGERAVL